MGKARRENLKMREVIFSTQNQVPIVLSVVTDENNGNKQINLLGPRLPLPFGYASADVSPTADGVSVKEADSPRTLCELPCCIEEVEKLWSSLLPLFSKAYVEGEKDGRDSFAAAVRALVEEKSNDEETP